MKLEQTKAKLLTITKDSQTFLVTQLLKPSGQSKINLEIARLWLKEAE